MSSTGWGSNWSGGGTWSGWDSLGKSFLEISSSDGELDGKGSTWRFIDHTSDHEVRFVAFSGVETNISSLSH